MQNDNAKFKNHFFFGLSVSWLVIVIIVTGLVGPRFAYGTHPDFDPSNLLSDGTFVNIDDFNASEIQVFFEQKGSFLKDYSEGGQTAAQIIWGAAHGHGDATDTINGIRIDQSTGTVNPKVILVTLEKEQSLISKKIQDDNALRKAMGYGCPDGSGCNPTYAGFIKQVEVGAWQLRYNWERAQGRNFTDYQVGQERCFDDAHVGKGTNCVTLANRATAALYRYTPHVYNGNHRFHELWQVSYQFVVPLYGYEVIDQSSYPSAGRGQPTQLYLKVRNTGSISWDRQVVRLGTDRPRDRIPGFIREGPVGSDSGWIGPDRIKMLQPRVLPGELATFIFWYTPSEDKPPGVYTEYFNLVADGISWLGDKGIYWQITVLGPEHIYVHSIVDQNAYPTLRPGQSYNFVVKVRNTGSISWDRQVVRLGTDRPRDRIPGFIREGPVGSDSGWLADNRVNMLESAVLPGGVATFSFWYTVPAGAQPGLRREYFRLVADGLAWLTDYGIYWGVTIANN